jgi:hypothetical protein
MQAMPDQFIRLALPPREFPKPCQMPLRLALGNEHQPIPHHNSNSYIDLFQILTLPLFSPIYRAAHPTGNTPRFKLASRA